MTELSVSDRRAIEFLKRFLAQAKQTPANQLDIEEDEQSESLSSVNEPSIGTGSNDRVYEGNKTPQNQFILDDNVVPIDSFPSNLRSLVLQKRAAAKERDERASRDEEIVTNQPPPPSTTEIDTGPVVRRTGETEASFRKRQDDQLKRASKKRKPNEPQPAKTPQQQTETTQIPQEQLLSLATLRAQLLLENSVIANLFFESRLLNLLSWYSKMKSRYAALEKALTALKGTAVPTATPQTTRTASKRNDETNQAEIEFYELIALRIVTLGAKIRREIIDMGGVLRLAVRSTDDPYENMRRATAERQRRSTSKVESDYDREVAVYKQRLIQKFVLAIDSLQKMIGLVQMKNDVSRYIISAIMQLDDYRLFQDHINILLFGQPGTGKTASAEKISNLLRIVGVVADEESASFLSFGRDTLVAQFEGQTAIKTRLAFAKCYGGVMMIDEFYQLISKVGQDSSGQESLDTIVKLSEDFKGEVLIIGAGYEDAIKSRVFASNEGISSRFPNQWRLPNYSASQLARIAQLRNVPRGSSGQDDDNPSDSDSEFVDQRLIGVRMRGVEVGNDFDDDVNSVLTEIIGRAWEANLFENQNARGARNLLAAIRDQKAVRIYGSILNRRRTNDADQEALVSVPYEVVDVYRGFAAWAKNAKSGLSVYYTDRRVDQLVS